MNEPNESRKGAKRFHVLVEGAELYLIVYEKLTLTMDEVHQLQSELSKGVIDVILCRAAKGDQP